MALNTVFFCLLGRYLPFVRFVTILAGQIHLQMQFVLAYIANIGVAFLCAVVPVRPCLDMRIVALVTMELHGCVGRDLKFDSLLYGFLFWLEVLDVDSAISQQFLPYRFAPMTEEAFFSARHEI